MKRILLALGTIGLVWAIVEYVGTKSAIFVVAAAAVWGFYAVDEKIAELTEALDAARRNARDRRDLL